MTFSGQIKEELGKIAFKDESQRLAELAGFLISNCTIQRENGEFILKMCSENELAIRRIYTAFKVCYNIIGNSNIERPKILGSEPLYQLKITSKQDLKNLFDESFIGINERLQITIVNKDVVIKDDECQKSFLRGVFLGSGSVSNPEDRYHLEIVANNHENALFINEIIESFGITVKMTKRKKDFVIYLKGAESISTFLAVVGASQGMLKFEETRVIKEVRNNINRVSNFENANFDKTVDASLEEIEDISTIKKYRKFAKLPSHLKEIAKLRLMYKEATFDEIGKMLEPNLSRAGVSHRFKKLHEYAEELRNPKE